MSSSSTVPSDDSDCKLSSSKASSSLASTSMSFIQQFQQVQQDQLEHKHSCMDFNYWKVKERKLACMEDHEHQLEMQHELHVHEQVMAAQEVKKMKLVVQLEQLRIQNLTLQKGIAGGEDQGTLSDSQNVHLTL
ncbi:hypothetical protein BKA82DRAFT_34849 [Pisolithus tinctorius]|uniref:Uncharacterized protein n=1 Tax=Pisolithus tinctorius Marx 270 TaxID=870435 RepID=A0A0C3NGM4_PISTI|nr:hypothetical protein BKA82DRAFT_34849 [Pisolithus tinctorius]KIN94628.1 hypothetical protein M404DRAFT_34849 [Pisolithus tinctorius Marx 270]